MGRRGGFGADAVRSVIAMRRLERTPHRFGPIFAICAIIAAAALVFALLSDLLPFAVHSIVYRGGVGVAFAGAVLLAALPSALALASRRLRPAAPIKGE